MMPELRLSIGLESDKKKLIIESLQEDTNENFYQKYESNIEYDINLNFDDKKQKVIDLIEHEKDIEKALTFLDCMIKEYDNPDKDKEQNFVSNSSLGVDKKKCKSVCF